MMSLTLLYKNKMTAIQNHRTMYIYAPWIMWEMRNRFSRGGLKFEIVLEDFQSAFIKNGDEPLISFSSATCACLISSLTSYTTTLS